MRYEVKVTIRRKRKTSSGRRTAMIDSRISDLSL